MLRLPKNQLYGALSGSGKSPKVHGRASVLRVLRPGRRGSVQEGTVGPLCAVSISSNRFNLGPAGHADLPPSGAALALDTRAPVRGRTSRASINAILGTSVRR